MLLLLLSFLCISFVYILKTPYVVFSMGAFREALRAMPRTFLESAGLITPSSQSLHKKAKKGKRKAINFHNL